MKQLFLCNLLTFNGKSFQISYPLNWIKPFVVDFLCWNAAAQLSSQANLPGRIIMGFWRICKVVFETVEESFIFIFKLKF